MERSDRSTPVRHSPSSWACRLALPAICLAASALSSEAQTRSPRYRFKMMIENYTGGGGACTAIDDLGRIATDVSNNGLVSLVRTDGTTTELIADTTGPIASFEHTHAYLQMNSSGTVAFVANMDAGGQTIYTWDGATLQPVMDLASLPWPLHTAIAFIDVSINASGVVVGVAGDNQGNTAIFMNDGVSTSLVVQSHVTSFWDYFTPQYVRVLDDGTIATAAYGSMFPPRELRCDPPFWADGAIVRLSPFGDILETLAAPLTDDLIVYGSFYWSANNSGDVIYVGGCPGAQTMVGASSAGQFVLAESESPGGWDFFTGASISNSGRIAYLGATENGNQSMVADGPDPVRNRVLGSGDVIFGKTVHHPALRFRDAINDAGQICMWVTFTDGTTAMVRADPRPRRRL